VYDLHTADAIYCQTCSVNFHVKQHMPMDQLATEDFRPKLGHLQDGKRAEAFLGLPATLKIMMMDK